MFVSVDRDNMTFLGKHVDYNVLTNLAWIENRDAGLYVFNIEAEGFQDFTNMELMMLLRSVTKDDHTNWDRTRLIKTLCFIAQGLPEVDVFKFELDRQAASIGESNRQRYRYVKGANKPAIVEELFPNS